MMIINKKLNGGPNDPINDAKKILANFLKKQVDDIHCKILTGGSQEATIIKCSYNNNHYVIKFFKNPESGKQEIAWTEHASNLGIGPKFYFSDPMNNYMITEFVQGNSLIPEIANKPEVIKNIAISLSKLHSSVAEFAKVSDMFLRIYTKYEKLKSSGKTKEILEESLCNVKKIEKELQHAKSLPTKTTLVPCHNDMNWGNIFVNDSKVILIDWEDAALDNPYYDIAAFLVLNVIDPENEKLFFEQYDPKRLNPQWQSYMQLCKHIVYFEFALNLLLGVQKMKNELLDQTQIPEVKDVNYYLTLLAKQQTKIDGDFLYQIALASLKKISLS